MEKRVVLAMLLSAALFMGYTWFTSEFAPPPQQPQTAGTPCVATGTTGVSPTTLPGQGAPPAPGAEPPEVPEPETLPVADAPASEERLDTEHLFLTVTSAGAALSRADAWGCVYHAPGDPDAEGDPGHASDYFPGAPGFGAVDLLGLEQSLSLRNWHVERRDGSVVCSIDVPAAGVRLVKTFTPSVDPAAPYHVILDVEAIGLAGAEGGHAATLEVVGPWYREPSLFQPGDGVLVAMVDEDVEDELPATVQGWLDETPGYEQSAPAGVRWIGTRSDFHIGALEGVDPLPRGTSIGFHTASRPGADPGTPTLSAAAALRVPFALPAAGETTTQRFRLFIGPNSRPLLAAEGSPYATLHDAPADRRFLGIGFGPIERVLGWLLSLIASTGMGYGLAVVCLTILVRGALFPLSRKSQISMRVHSKKMAAIKPKMDAIKKKYKDSKKQQEMTMKLMREEKVSPVPGGCLLAFVQMPVWISLYGILQSTFEMRHATFLWAKDLTAPDKLVYMPFMEGVPLLPNWLNLFPILMMITWGISSHMQPLPDDPQQRQTAKMMRWMPMMFGLILYKYPSGLTIYMTCSALWSIGEVQLIRRLWLKKLEA